MDLWYPSAYRAPLADAGPYLGGPFRGVLHTTEGDSYAGAYAAYRATGNGPHFTVSGQGVWQHIALDRSATALMHPVGTAATNRQSAVQIEIVGHAANPVVPPALAPLMRWIEAQTGIAAQAPTFRGGGSAAVAPYRMTSAAWTRFGGWCGHQHVPNNDHWDPGAIDAASLFPTPTEIRPMIDPPVQIAGKVVGFLMAPGGGVWLATDVGAVYAWGCPDYGAPNRHPEYWRPGQTAARIEPLGNGYTIVDSASARYDYPAS